MIGNNEKRTTVTCRKRSRWAIANGVPGASESNNGSASPNMTIPDPSDTLGNPVVM